MLQIQHDDAVRVEKSMLCKRKRHIMLFLIFLVFYLIPFKVGFLHCVSLPRAGVKLQYKYMVNCMAKYTENIVHCKLQSVFANAHTVGVCVDGVFQI
jgi:hypothetical protein